MFRSNDEFNVSIVNVVNDKGNFIPCSMTLPLEDEEEFSLDPNVVSVDVFEYQSGAINDCYRSFQIFVGESCQFRDIIDDIRFGRCSFVYELFPKIQDLNSRVCYKNLGGRKKLIIAVPKPGDLVVPDIDSLRNSIIFISNNVKNIKRGIQRIKSFGRGKKN